MRDIIMTMGYCTNQGSIRMSEVLEELHSSGLYQEQSFDLQVLSDCFSPTAQTTKS